MRATRNEAGKRGPLNLRIKRPKAYRHFLERLDAPAKPNKRLLKIIQKRPPSE